MSAPAAPTPTLQDSTSFLALESLHVLITGAAGGIGSEAVREFLRNGCRVTALDVRPIDVPKLFPSIDTSKLHTVTADLRSEDSIAAAFANAVTKFGVLNILVANAGITDEDNHPPIWEIGVELWDKVNQVNVRGTFLTIKHFLRGAQAWQAQPGNGELDNLAIVVTGSETGKFGQEGHAEYASGKAGLQYGLIRGVKNEIVRLNSKARINAVAPGWVNTELIGDRLDDKREYWAETQSTVALKKIAQPGDVARAMAFLASHRAAGHISGECLSVDGGMEGRLVWREEDVDKRGVAMSPVATKDVKDPGSRIPTELAPPTRKRRMRIALSIDFDAISGYLGTGQSPHNTLSDYSAGIFSARVGVPRLLKLFKKYGISKNVTWFMPGHSIETFPEETKLVVDSDCEIGLHGYSHEGAYQMTPEQEKDVLERCIEIVTKLKKRPVGYRAPLYQIRETTVALLEKNGFIYDSKPTHVPDFSKDAASWMSPTSLPSTPKPGSTEAQNALVEIPTSWYTEDMTPFGFYPYTPNSQGYVSVEVVEKMWWDRFDWLWENESFVDDSVNGYGSIFPMIWHPESAGRAHIVGMIDKFIGKLRDRMDRTGSGEITFDTFESVARTWKKADLS